ncbi:MAG: hypothetical protein H0T60_08100 [Acidobacteria bacterium]|nr:hypothetical protein [Acidobacteriota bacterium]
MAEQTEENRQPTTLERLEAVMKQLRGGAAAQAATAPGVENTPASVVAPGTDSQDEFAAKEARVGKSALSKGFLKLARSSKAFHHLGADRVLEDPRGYLRQKKANSEQFLVEDHTLEVIIQSLMTQKAGDEAEPLSDLQRTGLLSAAAQGAFGSQSEVLRRTLDTTSGAPLIRADIEPFLYEGYLRTFPASERIARVRANGLKHSYEIRTAIPQARTLNNLGDFSGAYSNSTFEKEASTRIAIIAAPVSISYVLALAVQQSGMAAFDLQGSDNLEVMGALTAIARKKQTLLLQGNQTVAGKTLNDEEGLYDALDHDGLRLLLMDADTSITMGAVETFRRAIRRASAQIRNAGGSARNIVVFCSEGIEIGIDDELLEFYRITNGRPGGGVDTNLSANGLRLGSNVLSEIVPIPADTQNCGMGNYTFGGNPVEDIDVLDLTGIKFPYIGSPTVTMLEIPMGTFQNLTRTFVPFEMSGLMVHIKNFHRKIRAAKQTI